MPSDEQVENVESARSYDIGGIKVEGTTEGLCRWVFRRSSDPSAEDCRAQLDSIAETIVRGVRRLEVMGWPARVAAAVLHHASRWDATKWKRAMDEARVSVESEGE